MNAYKNFLNLPKTNFSMKARLNIKELEILEKWKKNNIYNLINKNNLKNKNFFLHDGPPYANGNIHIGHAVNKILKDIILKYKRISGFNAPYIPCWDCHGLPIEQKIESSLKEKNIKYENFRSKCKKYVLKQIDEQKNDFIRLGVLADWENPKITMSYENEANTILTLCKILKKGFIYRDYKPIYWCLNCRSSLAEAEVEYYKKKSLAIYVIFKIVNIKKLQEFFFEKKISYIFKNPMNIIIFTTTLWTLPTCQAIALNPNFLYQIIKIKEKYYILSKKLVSIVMKKKNIKKWIILNEFKGEILKNLKCFHPITKNFIPIIFSEHVTEELGTGFVHMSPDHGLEDYVACKKYNIQPINIINHYGLYDLPNQKKIHKKHIFSINSILIKILNKNNKIFITEFLTHQYPHCWRHKSPIIFKATPQWFIRIEEKKFKKKIINEIQKISWIPKWGKRKMKNMILNRPDWCISRQRKWGVPIMFIMHKKTGKLHKKTCEIINKILKKVKKFGSQIWWSLELDKFIGKDEAAKYEKVTDILDVWFESGANHQLKIYQYNIKNKKNNVADLYLEGSDQYRGWFMSSLIISIAINQYAPYKKLMTHGFVIDDQGQKMSKSLNNSITPNKIIKKWGADILRLWVAYTDYSKDIKISEKVLKQTVDHYRKIRNTIRFLISNLFDFNPHQHTICYKNMLFLDKWILENAENYQKEILKYYEKYNFHEIIQKIIHFCSIELGSKYLELIKDRLYTLNPCNPARRSGQTTIYHLLQILVRWISPILSFTAEEIWTYLKLNPEKSVFITKWYSIPLFSPNTNPYNIKFWDKIFLIRQEINKYIEKNREKKNISHSLETSITLYVDTKLLNHLSYINKELKFIFSTSEVKLKSYLNSSNHLNKNNTIKNFKISISKHNGKKCNRCWHYYNHLQGNKNPQENICQRCINNINGMIEKRIFI